MLAKAFSIIFAALMAIPMLVWASLRLNRYQVYHLQPEMKLETINDLNTQRIVFRSFNGTNKAGKRIAGVGYQKDQAVAELLIIMPQKVYLIKDGFENPAQLKARKENYKSSYSKWLRQRKMLKKLFVLENQKTDIEERVGSHSPDYARLENAITFILRSEDEKLRRSHVKSEWEKGQLRLTQKFFGMDSPEYKKRKESMEQWQARAVQREKQLKQLLSQHNQNARQERESEIQEQVSLQSAKEEPPQDRGIFQWVPRPPFLKNADLFRNDQDGFPDYVAMTTPERRQASFQRIDSKSETWVWKNFSDFYKDIRNRHLQRYVNQYQELFLQPYKFSARVKTSLALNDPLCALEKTEETETIEGIKNAAGANREGDADLQGMEMVQERGVGLFRRVDIFSIEGVRYTALDCDDDGITETFLVFEPARFHWGVQDMPNAVSIFNNADPEIKAIIGDLVKMGNTGNIEFFTEFKNKQNDIQKAIQAKIKREEAISRQRYR